MDNYNKTSSDIKDILYSRTVKAGKRIYYLDVKEGRNHEVYMSVTESKKRTAGDPESPEVSFEKHKIFLYQEDIPNFLAAMDDVLEYIHQNAPQVPPRRQWQESYQENQAPGYNQDYNNQDYTDTKVQGETSQDDKYDSMAHYDEDYPSMTR